jgi:hypothetical protein
MSIMKRLNTKLVQLALSLVCTSAMAQHKSPTEAQCRQMVASMIEAVKSTTLETARDKKDARVLLERIEKTLQEHRARGASDCAAWDGIGKMATRQ